MKLKDYLKVVDIKDPIEQIQFLGFTPTTIGEAKRIIERELSIEYKEKEIKSFNLGGRKFKLKYDMEDMIIEEYALYKQIMGDVFSNQVDSEDNEIVVDEDTKYKKLFSRSNTIISIFTKETTLYKKHLSFDKKCELFLELDIQILINILFFYSVVIDNLMTNGVIYYLQKMEEKEM